MEITVNSLSYSTVNQYTNCPDQVWNDKILKREKRGKSINLVNGVALHMAAETLFYSRFYKSPVTPEILIRVFETKFNDMNGPDVIFSKQTYEDIIGNSKELIRLLYETELGENVYAVERTIRVPVYKDLEIITKPDLITQNVESGELTIWDLKSASKAYTTDDLKRVCEQTMLYSLAIAKPVNLKILLLLKKKKPEIQVIELNPEELGISMEDILHKFIMVKRALEAGIHYKNRSWACKTCPYSYICDTNQKEVK